MTVGDKTAEQTFYVRNNIHESMLSIDGMCDFEIVIHSQGYTTRGKFRLMLQNDACCSPLLKATHNITLQYGTSRECKHS